MPWRVSEEQVIQTKLKSGGLTVGHYRSDGNVIGSDIINATQQSMLTVLQVLPHPPVLRALDKVLGLLADNGNTVVPWTPYKHDYAVDLTNQIFAADGCKVSISTRDRPTTTTLVETNSVRRIQSAPSKPQANPPSQTSRTS
jgi:hypothetical protein